MANFRGRDLQHQPVRPDLAPGVVASSPARSRTATTARPSPSPPAGAGEIAARAVHCGSHLRRRADPSAKLEDEPRLAPALRRACRAAGLNTARPGFRRASRKASKAVAGELLSPAQLAPRGRNRRLAGKPARISISASRNCSNLRSGDRVFRQPNVLRRVQVLGQRWSGEKHREAQARTPRGAPSKRCRPSTRSSLPSSVRARVPLSVNEFNGAQNLQLVIEHWEVHAMSLRARPRISWPKAPSAPRSTTLHPLAPSAQRCL